MKLKELQAAIIQRFGLESSLPQCQQAKRVALSKIEKILQEHYAKVWEYGNEILDTNPGSTIQIRGDGGTPPRFQRMYFYFKALKQN